MAGVALEAMQGIRCFAKKGAQGRLAFSGHGVNLFRDQNVLNCTVSRNNLPWPANRCRWRWALAIAAISIWPGAPLPSLGWVSLRVQRQSEIA